VNPISLRSLKAIMKGTGIWMARYHCREKRLTLALQYPKGTFSRNTRILIRISKAIV
jgi:hypothetical protein